MPAPATFVPDRPASFLSDEEAVSRVKPSPYEAADIASMTAGLGKATSGMEAGTEFTEATMGMPALAIGGALVKQAIRAPFELAQAAGIPIGVPTLSPQDIAYLRSRYAALESPLTPAQPTGPTEQAITDWLNEQASGFTSPEMAGALGAPAVAKLAKMSPEAISAAGRMIARGFQAQMASGVPEAVQATVEAPDAQARLKAGLSTVTAAGLPLLIEAGLTKPTPKIPDYPGLVLRRERGVPTALGNEEIQAEAQKQAAMLALGREAQARQVLTAATYTDPTTGQTTTGPNHIEAAAEQGVKVPESRKGRETPEFGFEATTPATGETTVVSRGQGEGIAEAAGQLIEKPKAGQPLHSDQVEFAPPVAKAQEQPPEPAKPEPPVAPLKPEAGKAKQPWEMTSDEFKPTDEEKPFKIGDIGYFYRSGELPKSGTSKDYRSGRTLKGVSVYQQPDPTSMAGLSDKPWYFGKGKIVGIGSDGEPIIKPIGKWEKFSEGYTDDINREMPLWKRAHKKHVEIAVREGKPVPPEVLAEYGLKPPPPTEAGKAKQPSPPAPAKPEPPAPVAPEAPKGKQPPPVAPEPPPQPAAKVEKEGAKPAKIPKKPADVPESLWANEPARQTILNHEQNIRHNNELLKQVNAQIQPLLVERGQAEQLHKGSEAQRRMGGLGPNALRAYRLNQEIKALRQQAQHIRDNTAAEKKLRQNFINSWEVGEAKQPAPAPPAQGTPHEQGMAGGAPPIIGMGGAVPTEFEQPGSYVSNMFAAIDRDRAALGKPALVRGKGRTWDEDNQRALAQMNRDPEWIPRLIKELDQHARPLLSGENAGLVWHRAKLRGELNNAYRRINQAFEDKRTEDLGTAQADAARFEDELDQLDRVMKIGPEGTGGTGSEAGRSLQAQKMAGDPDEFNLVEMVMEMRALRGGKPFDPRNPKDMQELARLHKLSLQQEKNIADLTKHLEERDKLIAEMRTKAALDEAMRKAAAEKAPSPAILAIAEKIGKSLKTEADSARERIKARLGTVTFGSGPLAEVPNIRDYAIIGAEHIYSAGLDFAKWSAKMVDEFSDKIEPYLKRIFDESAKIVNGYADQHGAAAPEVKKVVKAGKKEGKAEVSAKIGARLKAGKLEDITGLIQKLARLFVAEGTKDRNALIDQIHNVLLRFDSTITRREAMDAISGYGKFKQLRKDSVSVVLRDLKGQMQQVGKLEDMAAGTAPLKTGVERRTPTDEERRLIKQVEEAKRRGGYKVTDPATQLRTALQAYKTRLANEIKDMDFQIARRQKIIKEKRQLTLDPEAEKLKALRDEKKQQFDAVFGTPEMTDARRLEIWKKRTQSRIDELEGKLRDKDYSDKTRRPIPFDEKAIELQARKNKLAGQWRSEKEKMRRAQLPWWRRLPERFVRWERAFKLSSPVVFGKLAAAAVTRGVTTAAEEVVGGGLSQLPVISEVARQAPREGGLNVQALAKAYAEAATKGAKEAAETLQTGQSTLEHGILGKPYDADWANFFGQIHGAIKAPVKLGEWKLSYEKRMAREIKNGADPSDPTLQMRIAAEALDDGYRAIFMQHGFSADMFNQMVSQMERSKKWPVSGEVSARLLRFLFPIVRVPINIVGETLTGVHGVPTASLRVFFHVLNHDLSTLDPKVADSIMRQFKKGSIGLGIMAVGFMNPNSVGGYNWREKRRLDEPHTGGFQIPALAGMPFIDKYGNLPRWLTHAPWFELMQIGATMRRTLDGHGGKDRSISDGARLSLIGLADMTPFYGEMIRIAQASEDKRRMEKFAGEMARGTLIPQAIQSVATSTDITDEGVKIRRRPRTFVEELKMGVPGLRQEVPLHPVQNP